MTMTIGRVARRAGVGVETVRFYERRGLIDQPSKPSSGGYRDYPPEVVERIQFIRQAQELGFSLREIGELLTLQADPMADCSDVREKATAKRWDVIRKIERLERIRRALDELIAACPGRGAHAQVLDHGGHCWRRQRPEVENQRQRSAEVYSAYLKSEEC